MGHRLTCVLFSFFFFFWINLYTMWQALDPEQSTSATKYRMLTKVPTLPRPKPRPTLLLLGVQPHSLHQLYRGGVVFVINHIARHNLYPQPVFHRLIWMVQLSTYRTRCNRDPVPIPLAQVIKRCPLVSSSRQGSHICDYPTSTEVEWGAACTLPMTHPQ